MEVIAKHEVAYKGKGYKAGDRFEISDESFEGMQGDVFSVTFRKASIKKIADKAKKSVEKSEKKK